MLTRRQKQVFEYIKKCIKENEYPPSLEEIGRYFKLSSPATVHQHIEALKTKGYLKDEPRTIQISENKKSPDLMEIPLLGLIAAGQPIETYENKETITVPKSSIGSGEHYALKVQGDSMINEGILDGSTVIVKKQETAQNGDTIVALINGSEVTLKKFYLEGNKIRLQPANPKIKPIIVSPDNLLIQGKVINIQKDFSFENNKKEILGQYFTKLETIQKLLNLLFSYKNYDKKIKILEPAFGTSNFIKGLKERKFFNIKGCEIDKEFTKNPSDFFELPIEKKYDLIIGNPPFSKYNIKESYYFKQKYLKNPFLLSSYLTKTELKKEKEKIENVFILKSLKHLKDHKSSIAFVLPISFFIKNKNKSIKNEITRYFSTIIIYQNDKVWFDHNIPCSFAIFTNLERLKNKIVLIFENKKRNKEILDIKDIHEELIPQVNFHKNNGYIKNKKGTPLKEFLDEKIAHIKKSYKENNVSASNILEKSRIPKNKQIEDYKIAITRVGNSSVGKCGLVNTKKDILNDMFYVFDVREKFKKNKQIKERICQQINNNLDYFRNITCRIGSKSIKKEDIYNFKVVI